MTISFDVFDTLITRKVSVPSGIFDICAEKLRKQGYDQYLCNNFSYFRKQAERQAAMLCQAASREAAIEDIYGKLSMMLGLSDEERQNICRLEFQTEIENVLPVRENITLLKKYISEGKKVILISDMYLYQCQIRQLLLSTDPVFRDIPLYVSCDCQASKAVGSLFSFVAKKENISYQDWIHIGDNRVSDVSMPEIFGISCQQYRSPKRGNAESKTETLVYKSSYEIGEKTVSRFLFPFVFWILWIAQRLNKKKICFVARDGVLLKRCADILIKKRNLSIQTFLVYGSRKAWRTDDEASCALIKKYIYQEVGKDISDVAFVDTNTTGISMHYLADILGMTEENPLTSLYFCMIEDHHFFNTESYFFSAQSATWIELYCRANFGSTIGYTENVSGVLPELEPFQMDTSAEENLEQFQKGVEEAVASMSENLTQNYLGEIAICQDKQLQLSDDKVALAYFGSSMFSNLEDKEYAPALTLDDVKMIFLSEQGMEAYNGSNLRLSIARSPESVRKAAAEYERLQLDTDAKSFIENRKKNGHIADIYNNDRILVYGAGKCGRELVRKILLYGNSDTLVAWTDSNWEKKADSFYPVISPKEALAKDFDRILISVKNANMRKEICEVLLASEMLGKKHFLRIDGNYEQIEIGNCHSVL